jgi:hypothetical protein
VNSFAFTKIIIMKNKKIIKLGFLAVLFVSGSSLQAQTTINAASNSATLNGITFQYSIGEMSLVDTKQGINFIITEGYLQPNGRIGAPTTTEVLLDETYTISVYPNPTSNTLFIETFSEKAAVMQYQLVDATGKTVRQQEEKMDAGNAKVQLDLSSFSSGTYFLFVKQANATKSFKIQKVN